MKSKKAITLSILILLSSTELMARALDVKILPLNSSNIRICDLGVENKLLAQETAVRAIPVVKLCYQVPEVGPATPDARKMDKQVTMNAKDVSLPESLIEKLQEERGFFSSKTKFSDLAKSYFAITTKKIRTGFAVSLITK